MTGRFAPSPSGVLHLGNLRTAAIAWLSARAAGSDFLVRIEDLDRERSSVAFERAQLDDLAAIGIDWDGDVVRQSERLDHYERAIERLRSRDLVYECYCTRREIRAEIEAAPNAPHLLPGSYPGTCRALDGSRREELCAAGRTPALRLRTDGEQIEFVDRIAGPTRGGVDDLVLRRNDGTPAYNLAVVVDDAAQGISEVVRGEDLLSSTPRQILLQRLLGYPTPRYLHVPLVVDDDGKRLAKRDGGVAIRGPREAGIPVSDVVAWIGRSLDLAGPGESITLDRLLARFDPDGIPRQSVPVPRLV